MKLAGKTSGNRISEYSKNLQTTNVKYGTDISGLDYLLLILLGLVKSVYNDCVTKEEIAEICTILPNNLNSLVRTMKVFSYIWIKLQSDSILFNSLSCFNCLDNNSCGNFCMWIIDYSSNHRIKKAIKKLKKIVKYLKTHRKKLKNTAEFE